MSQTERLYKIERLLRNRRYVPTREFLERLEVSRATLNRDLDLLRDSMGAPIVYDSALQGYRLGEPGREDARYELPGLWFNSREVHALLAFYHFLENLEPGLLTSHIAPLKERIKTLLESKDQTLGQITRRVRILPQATRPAEPACFQSVAHALLERKRLSFTYHGRARDTVSDRIVSPQRLAHYRDNWYLDAWDHDKRALRTFSLDRIRKPKPLDQTAKDIPDERLDRYFASSYGIFSGRPKRKALLRFTSERARWIAEERWHPQQKGRFEVHGPTNVARDRKSEATKDRRYLLEIPYSDDRELVLDILRYGPDVEVLRPKSLRDKVLNQLLRAVSQYRAESSGETGGV